MTFLKDRVWNLQCGLQYPLLTCDVSKKIPAKCLSSTETKDIVFNQCKAFCSQVSYSMRSRQPLCRHNHLTLKHICCEKNGQEDMVYTILNSVRNGSKENNAKCCQMWGGTKGGRDTSCCS